MLVFVCVAVCLFCVFVVVCSCGGTCVRGIVVGMCVCACVQTNSSLGQGSPLLLSSATVADIAAVLNKTNGQVVFEYLA